MRSDRAEDWVAELCNALGDLQDLSDVKRFLGALLLSECVYKQPDTDVALYLSLFQAELGPSLAPLRRVQCSLPHVLHRYILAEGSGQLWVVFAGTKHRRDLLTDANFALSQLWGEEGGQPSEPRDPADGGDASDSGIASSDPRADPGAAAAAHSGFLSRSQGIPIEEIYEHAVSSGLHLVLCGHSLGGAVAKLCALRLLRQLRPDADVEPPPITCITFACTAVGNRELGAMVDRAGWSLHFRNYLLPEDMVPRFLGMSLAAQTAAAATAASSTGDEQQHGGRGRNTKAQGDSTDSAESSSGLDQPQQSRMPWSAWRRMMALVPTGIVKLQQQELREALATEGRKGGAGARGMPMAEVEEAVQAEAELAAKAEEAAAAGPSGVTGPSSAGPLGIAVPESRWGALTAAMQMVRNTVPSYALFGHQYFLLPDEGAVPLRSIAQLADPKLVVQPLDDAAVADPRHRLLKSAASSVAVAQRRGVLELRNGFVHHRMFSYRGRVMTILASVPGCLPQPGAPTPEVSHMVVLATNIAPRVTATAALAMAPLVPPPRPVQFMRSTGLGAEDALPIESAESRDSGLDPQPRPGTASWFGAAGRTWRSSKIPGVLTPAEEARATPSESGERADTRTAAGSRLVVPVVVFGKGVDVCNCAEAEVLGRRLVPVQSRLPLASDSATKGSTAVPQRRRLHQFDRQKDDMRVQIKGVRGVLARTAKAASLTFGGLTTGGAVVSLESSRSLLDPKLAPRSRNWALGALASPSTSVLQSLPVTITMPSDSVTGVLDSVRPGQPSKLQLSLKSDFHSREIGVSFLPWKVALLSSPSCTGSRPLAQALSSLCSRTGGGHRPQAAGAGLSPQAVCQASGVQWLDLTTQEATLTRWRGRLYRFAQRLQSTCSLGTPVRSGLAATQHYGWSPVLAGSALAEAYTAAATGGAAGLAVWGGDTLLDALSGLLTWGSDIRATAKATRTAIPRQAKGWDPPAGAHAVVILHDAMQVGFNSPGDQHLVRDAARAARYAGLPVVLAVLGWEELHGSNKTLAVGLLRDYYGLADIRSSHVIGIGRWTAAQTAKQVPDSNYGSSTDYGANTPLAWSSSAEPRSRYHHAAVGVDISEDDAQILREKVHAVLCGLPRVQPKP